MERKTYLKSQVNMRNVKLSRESRNKCSNIKEEIWGNVANAIEHGDWWIPCRNRNYDHMKSEFEKGMRKFFNLDFNIDIVDFRTDIISYDKQK